MRASQRAINKAYRVALVPEAGEIVKFELEGGKYISAELDKQGVLHVRSFPDSLQVYPRADNAVQILLRRDSTHQ